MYVLEEFCVPIVFGAECRDDISEPGGVCGRMTLSHFISLIVGCCHFRESHSRSPLKLLKLNFPLSAACCAVAAIGQPRSHDKKRGHFEKDKVTV